jgi:flagellar basal-body rod modification protein FlgD
MQVNTTTSTSGIDYSAGDRTALIPKQTLDQDDFLKLLIAQLNAQDPMNPVSNAEFMGQMAQFSTLEQTKGLSSEISLLQASNMIGREVSLRLDDSILTGVVSAVQIEAGTPKVIVGGNPYDLGQVLTIAPAASETQL